MNRLKYRGKRPPAPRGIAIVEDIDGLITSMRNTVVAAKHSVHRDRDLEDRRAIWAMQIEVFEQPGSSWFTLSPTQDLS